MIRTNLRMSCLAAGLALGLSVTAPANATLTLNAQGAADGFVLSTVVSGFFGAYGPLGEAMLPGGQFITGSMSTGSLYVFKDVDGQTLADAVVKVPYVAQTGNPQYVMATAGGNAYGAQVAGGTFMRFAADGSATPVAGLGALRAYYGMWGAANGHLIASSNEGLVDIDPVAGGFRVINAGVFPDGVTVSNDGKTLYAEVAGNINAYSVSSGTLLASYSGGGHGPDGTGVISGGSFSGDIVVNNNDGTIGIIDTVLGTETIIASGGTRGDFVSADTSNGTLFLSQYEQVARLSCGAGCSIGGGPSPVPEPDEALLLVVGLAVVELARRRSRA